MAVDKRSTVSLIIYSNTAIIYCTFPDTKQNQNKQFLFSPIAYCPECLKENAHSIFYIRY